MKSILKVQILNPSHNVFFIDIKYLKSVSLTESVKIILSDGNVGEGTSYYDQDHPEFTKLRTLLEKEGFIKTERSWWNGDIVLKSFYLNDKLFSKNQRFLCASALGVVFNMRGNK